MVTSGDERGGKPGEDALTFVGDLADLAEHDGGSANDAGAEDLTDGLVSETDPEDGNFPSELPNHIATNTGLFGSTRPGANNNAVRSQGSNLINGDTVVPAHFERGPKFTHLLNEIPGKGVVVVDNQYVSHGGARLPWFRIRQKGVGSLSTYGSPLAIQEVLTDSADVNKASATLRKSDGAIRIGHRIGARDPADTYVERIESRLVRTGHLGPLGRRCHYHRLELPPRPARCSFLVVFTHWPRRHLGRLLHGDPLQITH